MKRIEDVDLKDKKVLIRTDYNVPVDDEGEVLDDKRIKLSVPTVKYVLEHGAKQVIVMSHMGRPKNNEDNLKTGKAGAVLGGLIGEKVAKVDDWGESLSRLPDKMEGLYTKLNTMVGELVTGMGIDIEQIGVMNGTVDRSKLRELMKSANWLIRNEIKYSPT